MSNAAHHSSLPYLAMGVFSALTQMDEAIKFEQKRFELKKARSANLELEKVARRQRRTEVAEERTRHLSAACPHCKAFVGMLCVTIEGKFPGRSQYATHAARR